jgi:antitoxin component YwqK of YwqJK toxin-antitoxin module
MEGTINGKNREGEWNTYYENGQVKEIGEYNGNKRVGLWRLYFEDGVLKGEIDYTNDHGTYTEYYHSGKILSEGPRSGTKNVGHWRFFAEDGTLQSEGEFDTGKKHGDWMDYYPSGKISFRGKYAHDIAQGRWDYYYENGTVSNTGEFVEGKKSGYWKSLDSNNTVKSEITYDNGRGDYREYFANGKLHAKGKLVDEKKEGKWEYFNEDGKKEGECEYTNGKGTYYGYFPNGNLQTKGTIDGDSKTGAWEIYDNDGKLSGYYRPFYDDKKLGKEITTLSGKSSKQKLAAKRKTLSHFDARFNEFRGVIVGTNPIMSIAGRLPLSIEFYLQERLGHEFEFIGIRDPFFKSDGNIAAGKRFERGYAICIKQKLYNQVKAGMWYFGHEIRFSNYAHFVNEPVSPFRMELFTLSAVEQRIEYGPLLGYRIMKKNNADGFTIDAFISGNIGYRGFDVDNSYKEFFGDVNQSKFSTSLHVGLNFGHVFSFK